MKRNFEIKMRKKILIEIDLFVLRVEKMLFLNNLINSNKMILNKRTKFENIFFYDIIFNKFSY